VKNDKQSMAWDTPCYQDSWQYTPYGSGGHVRFKEATAKLREYASEILAVQWIGDDSMVTTMWQCTDSCCTSKGRWYGRKDKFTAHQKTHAGGNTTFVKSDNRSKNRTTLGYCCCLLVLIVINPWERIHIHVSCVPMAF